MGKRCKEHTRRTKDGKRCLDCTNRSWLEWKTKNPEKRKAVQENSRTKIRYGVDTEWVELALVMQGYACASCGTKVSGGRGTWHIDHDHETERVRGLLCAFCNQHAIPTLERGLAESARLYLQKHGKMV